LLYALKRVKKVSKKFYEKYGVSALLVLLALSVVAPFVALSQATATLFASLTVNPTTFAPGTAVLVSSTYFAFTGQAVNIYLSSSPLATISPSDVLLASNVPLTFGGFLNVNVTIPSSTAVGTYYIKATDDNGRTVVVSNALTVESRVIAPSITLQPSSGQAGSIITVSGVNFGTSTVTIYFITGNPSTLQTLGTVTPSSGSFTTSVTIPYVPQGKYYILATDGTLGASAVFVISPFLAPELSQWDTQYRTTSPLYSIKSGQANLNLSFFGTGLPAGSVNSVTIYNSAGQPISTAVFEPTQVGSNGEFSTSYNAANGIPKLNVTIVGALASGVGYYAVFNIGGVNVKSAPFIASTPTNGLFSACMSSPSNPYSCTSSYSTTGSLSVVVQGYGFGANDQVSVNVVNGANTLTSQSAKADANGAIYVRINTHKTHFPAQTAQVVAIDHLASGAIQQVVGTVTFVPQLTVTDVTTMNGAEGAVGDTLLLSGTSFPVPFQASYVTITGSNGYTATVTQDSSHNNIQSSGYFAATNGDFAATSGSTTANKPLYITLPNVPGGNVTVTLYGATTAGAPVSIRAYFWVDTEFIAAYYINLMQNTWVPFVTNMPQPLFSGDIIDIQATGYPAGVSASVNFTASVINAEGTNIMGATALPNGNLELILSIPNLPASVQSGFGPYTLVLNGASAMMMLGQSINTGVQVKILQPGVYASQPPHVYINPANITPESLLGSNTPGVFPTSYEVGSTLNLLGVGFTGSAKEYVYIKMVGSQTPTYQLITTQPVTTNAYGVFTLSFNLPNESSYVNTGTMNSPMWTQVSYSVAVYEYNPSAVIQSPQTSTPTNDQAVSFTITPAIEVMPSQAQVNSTVTIVGTGFAAGETASVYFQITTLVPVGTAPVSNNGFFSVQVVVPAFSPGPVNIVAQGSSGKTQATAPFTILPPPPPPSSPTLQITGASTLYPGQTQLITVFTYLNGALTNMSSISGTVLLPTGVTQSLSFLHVATGEYQSVYLVPNITGTYEVTVTVTASNGLSTSGSFSFSVIPLPPPPPPSSPTLQITGASTLYPGQTQLITVFTYLNGALTNMSSISGTVLLPTGVTQSLSFLHVATGEYQSVYLVPNITGTYEVTVTVTASNGLSTSGSFSFSVIPKTTITTSTFNTTIFSSISSEIAALQSGLSSLQSALSSLASQTSSAISALSSSLSSIASQVSASFSSLSSRESTLEAYSLGALIIAFIALIVIIYGVFVRRRM